METGTDYISQLPIEIFIYQITRLPFDDVISLCSANRKLHTYCTDSKYNHLWKNLIDNTFGTLYGYQDKLNTVREKLNIAEDSYNYLLYTRMIDFLDPITQLMIYYKQGDTKSYNNKKYNDTQRFLAMFLLGEKEEAGKLYPSIDLPGSKIAFMKILNGTEPSQDELNEIMIRMAREGNVRGVSLFLNKGANIHAYNDLALQLAARKGHLGVVKYLVDKGADIHVYNDGALRGASENGHLEIVKYLVEHGADIHAPSIYTKDALVLASEGGHLEVVKYLVRANIHGKKDQALRLASKGGHLEVVKYLESLD